MKIILILKQKRTLLLLVISGILLIGILAAVFLFSQNSVPSLIDSDESQPNEGGVDVNDLKLYRNEEWGFEFEYPEDWILQEKTFQSYYSKFNLSIKVPKGKYLDLAFDLNIVLPEFPERSFQGIEKITSEVIVGGVQGIKYEYEWEGLPETAVILPFG